MYYKHIEYTRVSNTCKDLKPYNFNNQGLKNVNL